MGEHEGYYDFEIPIEKALVENGMVDDLFYLQDLKERKLFLTSDIDQSTVFDLVRHIMRFNSEDESSLENDDELPAWIRSPGRRPIILYVASNGGDIDAGFELIDAIENSKTPVYTVNLGNAYSMAMLVCLAGHKRFAAKHSKFLLHDGSNYIYNSSAKAQDQMRFQSKVEDSIREFVLSKSRITGEEYDDKLRVEWYMFADEAKEKGFIDSIVGVDCDIDEII